MRPPIGQQAYDELNSDSRPLYNRLSYKHAGIDSYAVLRVHEFLLYSLKEKAEIP